MWQLQLQDPNLFIGVVEGFPEINDILPILKERNIQKVWLMPFMSIAGDHARNDMAGPEEDSWKSILHDAGMNCEVILRGTGEYDEFVEIWIDHIRDAINIKMIFLLAKSWNFIFRQLCVLLYILQI
jgi:sirohydrochlorin cobaltochelatase